jgi:hypothetical protein
MTLNYLFRTTSIMRLYFFLSTLWITSAMAAPVALFDGKTFDGWEGDTTQVWRIEDGVIVGGSLEWNPQNEFLATTKSYKNFHLRFEYRLVGTEGFVNGGVQFRSERIAEPANEMSGFQADIGAGWTGCLYDESRRGKFLAEADKEFVSRLEKPGEWNSGEVVADGELIMLFINGQRTAIFYERDPEIAKEGKIALQIHGNCKAEISFRNLTIEGLPESEVPPGGVVLRRFGNAQPADPRSAFVDGRFEMRENEVIAMVGQEGLLTRRRSPASAPWPGKQTRSISSGAN